MSNDRVGIWIIGAWGGVATTTAVGLASLQKGLSPQHGLVTALPLFENAGLADWNQFVVGGHEIRWTGYVAEAKHLNEKSRVFGSELIEKIADTLESYDRNVKTGCLLNVGPTIEALASPDHLAVKDESAAQSLTRLKADLEAFRKDNNLSQVVVVNLSSTEPPQDNLPTDIAWADLKSMIETTDQPDIPASTLYAVAAFQTGCSYVNFTPSIGSDMPALEELAEETKTLHVGRDGKTGETLLKSVLAPMFAARNLHVMSWVGHNIFGNLDGRVLDDPVNKANKVRSKDHLLTEILGYKPQTLVSIEYIESMADWKTAWDHIHFQGFLGTAMTMQFTWQGCDSLLAAPLVLDLVRLTEREGRRGGHGVMGFLSSFFKSPMGTELAEFHDQYRLLRDWVANVSGENKSK